MLVFVDPALDVGEPLGGRVVGLDGDLHFGIEGRNLLGDLSGLGLLLGDRRARGASGRERAADDGCEDE